MEFKLPVSELLIWLLNSIRCYSIRCYAFQYTFWQEGEFVSLPVKKLRKRQMRNFFLCLMVSQVSIHISAYSILLNSVFFESPQSSKTPVDAPLFSWFFSISHRVLLGRGVILCYFSHYFQSFSIQGVPMIYMGDEYGHTKGGNNNTYCHDNYVILYNWSLIYCCLLMITSFGNMVGALNLSTLYGCSLQINYFRWDKKEESSSDFFRFCRLMTKFRQ